MTNEPATITLDAVRAAAAGVVTEYGSTHVYETPPGGICVYYHEGKPSCPVGIIMDRLGVPLRTAIETMTCGNDDGADVMLDKLGEAQLISIPPDEHDRLYLYVTAFQEASDGGSTWGSAKDDAELAVTFEDDEDNGE